MNTNLLDVELLQKLEKHFGNANDVYLTGLDRHHNVIVSSHRGNDELEFLKERINQEVLENVFSSVEISHVEAILEEQLEKDYIKLCSVITRVGGKVMLIWMVAAVIKERLTEDVVLPEGMLVTTEENYYKAISFLEKLSKQMIFMKEKEEQMKLALESMLSSEEAMKEQIRRSEAMTEILRLMEDNAGFAQLADSAIKETCQALNIEGGCLIKESADGTTVDVVCEYAKDSAWAIGAKLQGIEKSKVPFMDGKPYMLSSDSMMPDALELFFKRYHMQAATFQPVEINDKNHMYLCFYEFEKDRTWAVVDIKFINDAKRVIQSILERRIAKNSLAGSYASLEAILENVAYGIYVSDFDSKEILYINQRLKTMASTKEGKTRFGEEMIKKATGEGEFETREIYIKELDMWLDINQTHIEWVDGRKVCLGTVYDITEKKKYQQKIEKQISTDNLTGLYNRMRCQQDLAKYIKDAEMHGIEGAYLQLDLDDFKNINDGLGLQYGDALLKAIAHNLERIRGLEGQCYRTGGDEFVVILHDDTYKELNRICQEIRKIFEQPWFLKGADYFCTMSMGVVCFPTDGNTVEDVTRKSDMALLTAKKKGKNCVEFYNDKVEDTSFYRLDLEKNMRRATLNACNEFEVYYQPIINQDKPGNPCCGAEALIRWNSEELGFIPPTDFIPLAEYLGLINPIGDYVLYEAVKRCKYWNDCGHPEYKVNVNLSVIQLLQTDFVAKVKDVLDKTQINPKNVTLEVTESLAINDMERIQKLLDQVKSLGVKVALDDFGTGYSSLNHIREMPIDVIKIDRCFIENLSEDEYAGAFVKMVSELAKTIGVTVCVEGVEQKKQLEALKDMNVQLIQGYYYGKPMPVQDFEKMYL